MEQISFEQLPQAVTQLYNKLEDIERLLLEKNIEHQPDQDQLLTIQQAGELLNLSVPTLYGYVQRSAIPVSKKGKRLYFSKQDLMEWIKTGKKKTLAETGSEANAYMLSLGNRRNKRR